MRRALSGLAVCGSLVACARPPEPAARAPLPTPLPSGPVFAGHPPARLALTARALGLSVDGTLRYLVRAAFVDASGASTTLLGGGDIAFTTSAPGAAVRWQTRLRFGGPAAIVSFAAPRSATIAVHATVGVAVPDARIRLMPRGVASDVAAAALGPHTVQIGWLRETGTALVVRETLSGARAAPIALSAAGPMLRDRSVRPATNYRYTVRFSGGDVRVVRLRTPGEVHGAPLAAFAGKAMWLSFSPSPFDPDGYTWLDVAAVVAQARAARVRALELRVAYGPFWEITPAARATIDALIDAASAHGIAVVGWTVPRSLDADDVATAVAAASYRTARGSRFAAVAVDLERGDDFLGTGSPGYAALGGYLGRVRDAVGPAYPLVAIVEDPYLERLTNADVPYAAIAASADVLQPMIYWRLLSRTVSGPAAVALALDGSFAETRRLAGRRLPIDIGGQTAAIDGRRGAPDVGEIRSAVVEARRLGALGITFFDWSGTPAASWRTLAHTPW